MGLSVEGESSICSNGEVRGHVPFPHCILPEPVDWSIENAHTCHAFIPWGWRFWGLFFFFFLLLIDFFFFHLKNFWPWIYVTNIKNVYLLFAVKGRQVATRKIEPSSFANGTAQMHCRRWYTIQDCSSNIFHCSRMKKAHARNSSRCS